MTDFRALCAELLQELEHGSAWDYQQALKDQARAALEAQPEPQGPTNERLTWLWNHLQVSRRQLMALRGENCLDDTDYQQFARSVLKQWGRPAIEPVPVSERWPEFSDCDLFERVWAFNPVLDHWKVTKINQFIHTHWLPYWVLPVPGVEGADG